MKPMGPIDTIYAKLPTLHCQRKCQQSCSPILMTRLEWMRIKKRLGYAPKASLEEMCPMLNQTTGSCMVYGIRPLICRIYGLVEKMRCPWGCVPDRWLSDQEAAELMAEMAGLLGQGKAL